MKRPGYTIKQTSRGGFTFKALGGFDLRDAPELQAMGMKPHQIEKPEGCGKCGTDIPWHLFEVATVGFAHVCTCKSAWKWTSATTAEHGGKQS